MSTPCDRIDSCEFFREYCDDSDDIKAGWVSLFCGCMETSALCERKKYRLTMGQNPPANLAPTGRLL